MQSVGKKRSRQDWAWEFLRRNAKFCETWPNIASHFELRSIADTRITEVVVVGNENPLRPWGCMFTDAPTEPSHLGPIWLPAKSGHVLHLKAADHESIGAPKFDLRHVQCLATVMVDKLGAQHVRFREGPETLQLCITGMSIREPVSLFADTTSPKQSVAARLKALACLMELQRTGHLLKGSCSPQPRAERFEIILVALDAWLRGANYREIAIALFGSRRVEEAWTDPGRYLQDHVRRAVHRGRRLADSGYLDLVR